LISILRSLVTRLRADWEASRSRRAFPLGSPALWVYGFTLVYLCTCYLAGSGEHRHFFFREGGLVDCLSGVYLASGALLAWMNWKLRPSDRPAELAFWLVTAVGLTVLAFDERFQLHEQLDNRWLLGTYGRPLIGKNWNDVIVIAYGAGALVAGLLGVPTLARHRALRGFLSLGFVFYVLHTATDLLFERGPTTYLTEEPFKLLAGASFMLAFLQALRDQSVAWSEQTRPGAGWPGFTALNSGALLAFGGAILWLAAYRDRGWQRVIRLNWGDPAAWLVMLLLGAAALLVAISSRPGSTDRAGERWFWRGVSVVFAGLALGEATVAARRIFRGATERGILGEGIWSDADLLSQELNARTVALIVVVLLVVAAGYGFRLQHGTARAFLVVWAGSTAALLVMNWAYRSFLPPVHVNATDVLRLLSAVAALSAALSLMLSRVRARGG
jgi:hypothetical protein